MAENLNRIALGLNGLLQIKSGSGSPRRLGDDAFPILEMLPFYAASDIAVAGQTGNATAVGASVTVTIPSNQSWLVHNVSGRFSNAGGANRTYALGLVCSNFDVFPDVGLQQDQGLAWIKEQLSASGAALWVNWSPGSPIIFRAGTNFILRVLDNIGGFAGAPGSDIDVHVLYNRLES